MKTRLCVREDVGKYGRFLHNHQRTSTSNTCQCGCSTPPTREQLTGWPSAPP